MNQNTTIDANDIKAGDVVTVRKPLDLYGDKNGGKVFACTNGLTSFDVVGVKNGLVIVERMFNGLAHTAKVDPQFIVRHYPA